MVVIHISRFGAIPKKRQPGRWWLIVDLSSQLGRNVNDFINPLLCSLSYASVDDAAAFVLRAGRGSSSEITYFSSAQGMLSA